MKNILASLVFICLLLPPLAASAQDITEFIKEGDRYFGYGDYQEAARVFGKAAKQFPEEAIPRLARGHSLFAMRRYARASRSLQDGIRLQPQWSESNTNLRKFFRDPEEFDVTVRDLARRVRRRPNDQDLLFMLAYSRHFSGRREQARELFDRLLAMAPEHEAARTFVEPQIGEEDDPVPDEAPDQEPDPDAPDSDAMDSDPESAS